MRDCDKIGRSAIEDLLVTRNKAHCFLIFSTFQLFFVLIQFLKLSFLLFATFAWVKTTVNSFPEAHNLLSEAHKTGAHFSCDEKRHK